MLAGALLAPVLAVVAFNVVIFVLVMSVLIKHSKKKIKRARASADGSSKEATIRLLISIFSIMNIYGLTWLFAIFTFTEGTFAFQLLFAIFNSLQGFFLFLFFCVLGKEARESWATLLCRGKLKRFAPHTSTTRPVAQNSSSTQTNTYQRRYTAQTTGTLVRSTDIGSSQARRSSYSVDTLRSLRSSRQEISEEPSSISFHEETSSSIPDLIEINNQALAADTLERPQPALTPMLTLHEEDESELDDTCTTGDVGDLESVVNDLGSSNAATPMCAVINDAQDTPSNGGDSGSVSGASLAESGIITDDDNYRSTYESSPQPPEHRQQDEEVRGLSSPQGGSVRRVIERSQPADDQQSDDDSEVLQNRHAQ